MCAIVGLWRKHSRIVESDIEVMRDTMRHRGPDGAGLYLDRQSNVALGHRRLAIIDLSEAGKQPMLNTNEDIALVLNGEIYNYRTLRQQAETWGYRFKSTTDTEVIIALYERYGVECLQYLRGMFAFALWDSKRHQLLLARDRIGIKPLYVYQDSETIAFASEVRAFQALTFFDKTIDVSALFDFFSYQYIPAPKSIFRNVQKLMAGHYVIINTKTEEKITKCYWNLPKDNHSVALTSCQVVDKVDEILRESVALHLISDVPVGAFLSSGIDSSIVVAIAAKKESDLATFTVNFNEKNHRNEGVYAKQLADTFGVRHQIITMQRMDFEEFTEKFADIYDEPFGDTSGIPTYLMCQAAARSVKVALSGDGGDEVFGGYVANYIPMLNSTKRTFASGIAHQLIQTMPVKFGSSILYRQLSLQQKMIESTMLLRRGQKRLIFNQDALQASNLDPTKYDDAWKFHAFQKKRGHDYVRERMEMDMLSWLPEKMLTKVDRASMAHSLEVRIPLIDHLLVDFMFRLPSNYQWHPEKGGKWVEREVLERYVSASLINRPKQGFSIPLNEWTKQLGMRWVEQVRESQIVRNGIFSWRGIKMADTRSSLVQWMIVNVAIWSNRYSWSF
ncbi:MAG: asparagine synthase (glutamine-hydrolyzing) [Armatimonadetes bacterium]|nr:asparagine synthase (glutamine-hydrolyzing) [Armatimonadota bacterium]